MRLPSGSGVPPPTSEKVRCRNAAMEAVCGTTQESHYLSICANAASEKLQRDGRMWQSVQHCVQGMSHRGNKRVEVGDATRGARWQLSERLHPLASATYRAQATSGCHGASMLHG